MPGVQGIQKSVSDLWKYTLAPFYNCKNFILQKIIVTFLQNTRFWAKIAIFAKKSILTGHFRGVEYYTGPKFFFWIRNMLKLSQKNFMKIGQEVLKIEGGSTPPIKTPFLWGGVDPLSGS